jgi:hypothetical protein
VVVVGDTYAPRACQGEVIFVQPGEGMKVEKERARGAGEGGQCCSMKWRGKSANTRDKQKGGVWLANADEHWSADGVGGIIVEGGEGID